MNDFLSFYSNFFVGYYADFISRVIGVFIVLASLLVMGLILALVFCILNWLWRTIFFRYSFSEKRSSPGKIGSMHYSPAYTTYISTGKTISPVFHPSESNVTFTTKQGETEVDSAGLYTHVTPGMKIEVTYQERYQQPRFWAGKWKVDGLRLLNIKTKDEAHIAFNDAGKPIKRPSELMR